MPGFQSPGAKCLWKLLFLFLTLSAQNSAQTPLQTIRGTVIDQDSEISLPGATLVISSSTFRMGVIADQEGIFRAEKIPVGRYQVEARYVGYESRVIPEVLLTSARPVVLEIRLQESVSRRSRVWKSRPRPGKTSPLTAWPFPVQELLQWRKPGVLPGASMIRAEWLSAFAGVAGGSPNDNALVHQGECSERIAVACGRSSSSKSQSLCRNACGRRWDRFTGKRTAA